MNRQDRRVNYSRPLASILLAALALLWSAGCGDTAAGNQASVQGTVSFDGQPVDGGAINFLPIGGGRAASAMIQQGRYEIPQDRGPTPGKYRVEITWTKGAGAAEGDDEEDLDGPDASEQVIPAQYNRETELERDIETGDNEHNFELTSS